MLLYGRLIVQHLTQRILGEKTICELLDIFTEPLSIYLFIYATKCCLSISILDRVGSNSSDSGAIVLTQLVSTCIVIHEHVISLYSLTLQIKYQIIHRTYKMCYSCLSFCETRQKKRLIGLNINLNILYATLCTTLSYKQYQIKCSYSYHDFSHITQPHSIDKIN